MAVGSACELQDKCSNKVIKFNDDDDAKTILGEKFKDRWQPYYPVSTEKWKRKSFERFDLRCRLRKIWWIFRLIQRKSTAPDEPSDLFRQNVWICRCSRPRWNNQRKVKSPGRLSGWPERTFGCSSRNQRFHCIRKIPCSLNRTKESSRFADIHLIFVSEDIVQRRLMSLIYMF